MMYPAMPPSTDAMVLSVAYHHARRGRSSVKAIWSTSGGIGKKLDSLKESRKRAQFACRLCASERAQSYIRRWIAQRGGRGTGGAGALPLFTTPAPGSAM